MHTSTTFRYLYLPWLSGLLIMAIMLLTQSEISQPTPLPYTGTKMVETPQIEEKVSKPVITTIPFFPGCDDLAGQKKRDCSNERMYSYIYDQAAYPVGQPSQRTAGIVEIEFLITANGSIRDRKLLRSPGHRRGEDALRIINNMEAEGIRWEPSTRDGQPISARMVITIHYNMVWAGTKPK